MLGWRWGGMTTFLALLHTCWMLRKMLGWGGGDDDVSCTFAHMLDATQDAGLGWGGWRRSLLDATQDAGLGWGGWRRSLRNEFAKTVRRYRGNLRVHTGTIDGVWRCKKKVDKFQLVDIHRRVAMAMGSLSNRRCLYESNWDKMAKMWNVVVLKHETTAKRKKVVFAAPFRTLNSNRFHCKTQQKNADHIVITHKNGDSHHMKHCKTQHFNKILGCKMLVARGRFPIRRDALESLIKPLKPVFVKMDDLQLMMLETPKVEIHWSFAIPAKNQEISPDQNSVIFRNPNLLRS